MHPSSHVVFKPIISFVICFIIGCLPQYTLAQLSSPSYWEGTLDDGQRQLQLKFVFQKNDDEWSGTLYSPDESHIELPIKQFEITDQSLKFTVPSTNGVFEGKWNGDQSKANGVWKQRGADINLELNRIESIQLPKLDEVWRGTLSVGKAKLEMGLKIYQLEDGGSIAKLDSYTQGVKGIPVEFSKKGPQYEVKNAALGLTYVADRSSDGQTLNGTFTQSGNDFPLDMKRISTDQDDQPKRPQTPKAPFPYQSEDVQFTNATDNVTLAGTLTIPEGKGPFAAAILISGSGSQDRDETIFEHKPFWVISDYLSRRGVAVLRFDDRGFGESTGAEILTESTSEDFARDVSAGIDFLKTRPEIDPKKIGLIGHSEGGLIAPLVASQNGDVAFIISLAGTGVDGGEILISQIRAAQEASGVDKEMVNAMTRLTTEMIKRVYDDQDLNKEVVDQIVKAITEGSDQKITDYVTAQSEGLLTLVDQDWSRFFIKHDPAEYWRKVTCPVLALNGDKDLQVLADLNLPPIEAALKQGGNTQFEIKKLANLNHLFQETEGPGLASEYGQLQQTISPVTLVSMQEWLDKILD